MILIAIYILAASVFASTSVAAARSFNASRDAFDLFVSAACGGAAVLSLFAAILIGLAGGAA